MPELVFVELRNGEADKDNISQSVQTENMLSRQPAGLRSQLIGLIVVHIFRLNKFYQYNQHFT
jgi:hypothetical protein